MKHKKKSINLKDVLEKLKLLYLKLQYQSKCRKLNISHEILEVLIDRYDQEEVQNLLNLIKKNSTQEEFKENIINYCQNNQNAYIATYFLLGTIVGNYSFFSLSQIPCKEFNFNNFKELDYQESLKVLRENLVDYLLSDNQLKNQFLIDEKGNYNYTLDLDKEKCKQIFDDVVKGIDSKEQGSINESTQYEIVRDYIVKMIGIYGNENIQNNFDFILYDLQNKKDSTLEERKKIYLEQKSLNKNQINKLNNLDKLVDKLKKINSSESKKLIEKIDSISDDKIKNISTIEDIYIEYEILFRNDIVSHLFRPTEKTTLIENFTDLKPQLLHIFLRKPEKFRNDLENKILDGIISERKDKSNISKELSMEEQKEFERRKMIVEPMIDPTQVNYSYDSSEFVYSDKDGFNWYHSDTSNQIATSIYSENYYLNHFEPWIMGVGFNQEGLTPEAIALSSDRYLTTNKGLNNLEYKQSEEFNLTSATYSELISNDGKSEVVLFRRNIDYDTKAGYVFLTIDSSNQQKCEEYIYLAKEMCNKNNMKLVIYDLYKIRKSYEDYLKKENNYYEKGNIEPKRKR
ncbi:MAG: hypothetical protein ACI4U0_01100 [Candidatus Aphodocola sp.]